jgi:hypothetical protein
MKELFSYYKGGVEYFTPYQWIAILRDERTKVSI